MKLRTIKFWALYLPRERKIIATNKFKKNLRPAHDEVLVKLSGFYIPPSRRKEHGN